MIINLATFKFEKKSKQGRHSSPKAGLLTIGDTTLPRSQWPKHQKLSVSVWYARLKKYKAGEITEAQLLAPAMTKAEAARKRRGKEPSIACSKCGETKPAHCFSNSSAARTGRRGTCKLCISRTRSEKYQNNYYSYLGERD